MQAPRGVGVAQLTGDLYVADEGNDRVDEFAASGAFVRAWGWSVNTAKPEETFQVCTSGSGCRQGKGADNAGALNQPDGIAVDGFTDDVYVIDRRNSRVQKFSPEGEFMLMFGGDVNRTTGGDVCSEKNLEEGDECQRGSEGTAPGEFINMGRQGAIAASVSGDVFVGDRRRVQEFGPEGELLSSFPVVAENQVEALTVTSGGRICLTINPSSNPTQESPPTEVRCYSPAGILENTIVLEEHAINETVTVGIWLAADEIGGLFVDEYLGRNENGSTAQSVTEYEEPSAFEAVERFGPPGDNSGSLEKEAGGLALLEASKAATGVVVGYTREDAVRSASLPPPGPVVEGEEAQSEPAGCVRFKASVDPEHARTEYQFAYGSEPHPTTLTTVATMAAEGLRPETVSVIKCGLRPSQLYHYHVIAKNVNGTVEGSEETVETLPPIEIDGLSVGDVSDSGVTFEAEVNPLGSETEYQFEYAPSAGGAYTATAGGDVGAGVSGVRVSAHVSGLNAHTRYTYRLVAHNALGEGQATGIFETRRAGIPPGMLDGRVWEQVSPARKHSAAIKLAVAGGVVEATPAGDGVTYYAVTASEAEPEGEPVPIDVQIMSRHDGWGWASKDIATRASQRQNNRIGEGAEYWLFSNDLGRSVVEANPFTALSEWTVGQERTPYVRDESKCAVPTSAGSECFVPLATDMGPFADVEPGIEYGGPRINQTGYVVAVGATPDLARIVLMTTQVELIKGASTSGLYEWSDGRLALLSIAPGGGRCAGALALGVAGGVGNLGLDSRNALSPDGSLAVWSNQKNSGDCSGHVFLRDTARESSVQVDEVQGGSGVGVPAAEYQDASVGDRHVFFLDSQRLTADASGTQVGVGGATATEADLYEYAFDPATGTGRLVDMTAPVHAGEAAGVLGVLGASEDGSMVYVVAEGVLSEASNARGESAMAGGDNVYVLQRGAGGWGARFVTTLSGEDGKDWAARVAEATARVSPNGRWLAFMSDRSLTGYDNRDRTSGARDEEVFLYGAAKGSLICASCDPAGARPTGLLIKDTVSNRAPLVDSEIAWEKRWLSGVVPVRYAIGIRGELGLYQPRYLSDGGRLFFDSTDALVPGDTNHTVDVYEYEPPSNGEVAASDSCGETGATFAAAAEGCISLISSGASNEEAVFLDASENGNDAFFLTAGKLTAGDTDTAYDVYDAHACGAGASWACRVTPPVEGASCDSGAACKELSTPEESPPAALSEVFEGADSLLAASQDQKKVLRRARARCVRARRHRHARCHKVGRGGGRARARRSGLVGGW